MTGTRPYLVGNPHGESRSHGSSVRVGPGWGFGTRPYLVGNPGGESRSHGSSVRVGPGRSSWTRPHLVRRRRERGATLVVALVLVLTCVALAASTTLTHASAQKSATTSLAQERSFQAADAGVDWGVSKLRALRGAMPSPTTETRALDGSASFTVRYVAGNADGIDDDNDGSVDEADESDYTVVASTGTSGRARHTVRVIVSRRNDLPPFTTAAAIESTDPILTLNGNSFDISGADHNLNGSPDNSAPETYALTSPAPTSTLTTQVPAGTADQLGGLGSDPSIGTAPLIDLEALWAKYRGGATIILEPGTHTHGDFGTATTTGMQVVAVDGNLHLSANTSGAGVLLVHGDLVVSGSFSWTGIIIVTGRASLVGTGNERIVGAILAGEELSISGNVSAKFSSAANGMAKEALTVTTIASWIDPARH